MKKNAMILILMSLALNACFGEASTFDTTTQSTLEDTTTSLSESESSTSATIKSIAFTAGDQLNLFANELKQLSLLVSYDQDANTLKKATRYLDAPDGETQEIIWYSNDDSIVSVSVNGLLRARGLGSTHVLASVLNKTVVLAVNVKNPKDLVLETESISDNDQSSNEEQASEDDLTQKSGDQEVFDIGVVDDNDFSNGGNGHRQSGGESEAEPDEVIEEDSEEEIAWLESEEPATLADRFLNDDMTFYSEGFVDDTTFGRDEFPEITYGVPGGSLDVVSLGSGGELIIEFANYLPVDGDGPDFTIFENPFYPWYECAEISVSEDGENYFSFACDQYDEDEVYAGCAGVGVVNSDLETEDYLDPALSGGDTFDLADLGTDHGMSTVRFLKIKDIGLCLPSEDDAYPNPGGFDLDALVIINGVRD
ncbi:MAG: hypothetical protein H7A33_06965 [Deltaproteobacteria bacterium]|nr:hypothetical protein [Deltaproteobacteria bacterium]